MQTPFLRTFEPDYEVSSDSIYTVLTLFYSVETLLGLQESIQFYLFDWKVDSRIVVSLISYAG